MIVPNFGRRRHHEVAISIMRSQGDIDIPVLPELRTRAARDARLVEIESQLTERVRANETWVLSSEYFAAGFRSQTAIESLREYLSRWFDDVTAIAYFRRQDSIVPSLFTERAKTFVPDRPPLSFDASFLDLPAGGQRLTNVNGMIRQWQSVFDVDFFPRPYLMKWRDDPGALVQDFSNVTGVDIAQPLKEGVARPVVNRAISAQGVAFLLWIYPELNARVLSRQGREDIARDDPIGQLLAAFCWQSETGQVRLHHGAFTEAVARATTGPQLRLTQELRRAIDDRFTSPNADILTLTDDAPEWQEWLAEPSAAVAGDDQLSLTTAEAERIVDTIAASESSRRSSASIVTRIKRRLRDRGR